MKRIYKLLIAIPFIGLASSCQSFLDKGPLTKPDINSFINSGREGVEEYVNNLYTSLPSYGPFSMGILDGDINSDNMVSQNYDKRIAGLLNVNESEEEWKKIYQNLRNANYLLTNLKNQDKQGTEVKSLIGETYFFRAWWHFQLLKEFGSAPIMNTLWDDKNTLISLQIPANTRTEIAKFILADLDKAESLLEPRSTYQGLRINKEAAMVLAMNVALYEGSWEHYHADDAFAAPTNESEYFLNQVITIGDKLMAMGTIQLYTIPGDKTGKAFATLFNSTDLSNIPEVLLWRKYSISAGIYNNMGALLASGTTQPGTPAGITKSLVDSYINQDGSYPDIKSESYKDYNNQFKGRDPRLLQTIMNEGAAFKDTTNNFSKPFHLAVYRELDKQGNPATYEQDSIWDSKITVPNILQIGAQQNLTGYQIRLGINTSYRQGQSETAMPLIRYSEALLDYAEAAELLGKATDDVLNKTIKLLDERAGVTYVKATKLDPNFPDYGYTLTPTMEAIRRERRAELALQGYRFDDLMRWNGAKLIIGVNQRPRGAWLGDQSLLFKSLSKANQEQVPQRLTRDKDGYLDPLAKLLTSGYQFNPNRDYLLPIPSNQLQLDRKLKQNPGW